MSKKELLVNRQYTDEFKVEAVRLSASIALVVRLVADLAHCHISIDAGCATSSGETARSRLPPADREGWLELHFQWFDYNPACLNPVSCENQLPGNADWYLIEPGGNHTNLRVLNAILYVAEHGL
jgi:hypothetical protein